MKLHWLHSPDLPDVQIDAPDDPKKFMILVQAFVGSEDSEGEDAFTFVVCTPSWIEDEVRENGYLLPLFFIVVPEWDYGKVHTVISDLCARIGDGGWDKAARRLSRYALWEFDDYRDSDVPHSLLAPRTRIGRRDGT